MDTFARCPFREEAHALWSDGTGNVYVAGETDGDFDGQMRAGESDLMLVKFKSDGTHEWTRFGGSANTEYAIRGLAADAVGNLFSCATTFGSFGGQTNPGSDSAVLSRWRMAANTAPQATLVRPLPLREYIQGESILCSGYATDDDDGTLTNLMWNLGTNAASGYGSPSTLAAVASPGLQTVTLRAVDLEGATGTAQVAIQIVEASVEGLPLAWQTNYWPEGGSGGATNDADNDGLDNYTEWLTGTSPTNSSSYFRCRTIAVVPQGLALSWPSRSNVTYSLWAATNLLAGEFHLIATPEPTPPINTVTVAVDDVSTHVFQLRVER